MNTTLINRDLVFRKKWIAPNLVDEIIEKIDSIKKDIQTPNLSYREEQKVKYIEESIERFAKNFYPDIIVHKRGSNKFNLLVIEAKKGLTIDDLDSKKLSAFTAPVNPASHYHYQLGARINIRVGRNVLRNAYNRPVYYVNGAEEQV